MVSKVTGPNKAGDLSVFKEYELINYIEVMDEKIKEGISKVGEGLLNVLTEMQGEDENSVQKSKNNRKKCSRDEDDSCDSNTEKKIKIWTWGIAFVLIVLQVAFLKWWTVLTGVATAFAAYYVAEMLIKMDDIKEVISEFFAENKGNSILWIVAAILIVVQIFIWQWWTLLTGPLTVLIAFLLQKLFGVLSGYFNGE